MAKAVQFNNRVQNEVVERAREMARRRGISIAALLSILISEAWQKEPK